MRQDINWENTRTRSPGAAILGPKVMRYPGPLCDTFVSPRQREV